MVKLKGFSYIEKTEEYLDYLRDHFSFIEEAFDLVRTALGDSDEHAEIVTSSKFKTSVENHDLSKFSSEQFTQYRDMFFPVDIVTPEIKESFREAWARHEQVEEHHVFALNDISRSEDHDLIAYHLVIDLIAMSYAKGGSPKEFYKENLAEKINNDGLRNLILKIFDDIEAYLESRGRKK